MASEAAILGVPAVYLDYQGRCYTDEEEQKFGMVYYFKKSKDGLERSLNKAEEILHDNESHSYYREMGEKMTNQKSM